MMPDISVVIVSYNTREILRRCLHSLDTATPGMRVQTIVVDNGSSDGSVEMLCDAFPHLDVLRNPDNLGFAGANNQGLEIARAEVVILLNSDAFLTSDAVTTGLDVLRQHSGVGIVGVTLLNDDGSFQAAEGRFPTLLHDMAVSVGLDRVLPIRRKRRTTPGRVDWVQGACMFVRRSAIDRVGPLDTGFFMYSEEVEWCWRFWQLGWEVWQLPDVQIVHLGGASSTTNDLSRRVALYRSRLAFRRRLGGPVGAAGLWTSMILGLTGRIGVRAAAELIVRKHVGNQSVRSDVDLLRSLIRVNPLSPQATR